MLIKGRFTPDSGSGCADRPWLTRIALEDSQHPNEMNRFFCRARAQNIIGQCGASIVTVALCWNYADSARLIAWLIAHQISVGLMIVTFTSRWTTSRLTKDGIPKFATTAMVLAMTLCGSVMLIDVKASENITFTLGALIVVYAVAAGAMVTLGPLQEMARHSLFGLLLPSAIVSLFVGHYAIGTGTLFFLAVVALAGVSEMSHAYQELVALRIKSARAAAESNRLVRLDSLTGLFSRIGVAREFARTKNNFRSAMFIDLDRFKQVNDQAGHQTGDLLLKQVAARLTGALPSGAIAGRLGGDEFLILQPTCDRNQLIEFADEVIDLLETPFVFADGSFSISASIGISIIEEGATLEGFLYESDNAMYQAKRVGRGAAAFFTGKLRQQLNLRSSLENELRSIIDKNEFPVYGQPVYDLETGRMQAVELLARLQLSDGTRPSPSVFIPILEELGLIHQATRILIQQAAELKAAWQGSVSLRDVAVAINISPQSLACDWLVTDTCEQMTRNGLHPGDLVFEITEQALISDADQSEITLRALCDLGIKIAMDDFGTGYSSLDRLLRMPISYVKIDKSIVQKTSTCERNKRLLSAIVEVASSLGQDIVAEGIETRLHLMAIMQAGVSFGQGYYLGRPMPLSEIPLFAGASFPIEAEACPDNPHIPVIW